MRIKNGKLTDYNYWDIKEIVKNAVWKYIRQRNYSLVRGLRNQIDSAEKEAESMPKIKRR